MARKTTPKAVETKQRIYASAMRLFREQGFGDTTMRQIASDANVATGAPYYYFGAKEQIVIAYYEEVEANTTADIVEQLETTKGLDARLECVSRLILDYMTPNRKFLGALFGHAADPKNPLSPFSEETLHIRATTVGHFRRALEGSGVRIPTDLGPRLPELVWLYHMGVILYWVYDQSEDQARTRVLHSQSVRLVSTLIRFSGLPLMKPVRRRLLELMETVAPSTAAAAEVPGA